MAGWGRRPLWAGAIAAAAVLAGCDNGPSAVADKQAAGSQMASAQASGGAVETPKVDHRKDPVKLVDGKPEWAASRRYSAEESARRAYDRNGEAFGAAS